MQCCQQPALNFVDWQPGKPHCPKQRWWVVGISCFHGLEQASEPCHWKALHFSSYLFMCSFFLFGECCMSIFSHCCGNSNTHAKEEEKKRKERIENSVLRHNQFGWFCPLASGMWVRIAHVPAKGNRNWKGKCIKLFTWNYGREWEPECLGIPSGILCACTAPWNCCLGPMMQQSCRVFNHLLFSPNLMGVPWAPLGTVLFLILGHWAGWIRVEDGQEGPETEHPAIHLTAAKRQWSSGAPVLPVHVQLALKKQQQQKDNTQKAFVDKTYETLITNKVSPSNITNCPAI